MMGTSDLDRRVAALVGRDRERAVIDRLLGRARLRQSGSLVIRAEAGMGKTALLRYAAAEAREMLVLSVTGVEAESDLDYSGMHSLVRPIIELIPRLPEPQRAALAAALGLAPGGGADRFLVSAGRALAARGSRGGPSRRSASSTTRSGSTCRWPVRSCSPQGGLAPKGS